MRKGVQLGMRAIDLNFSETGFINLKNTDFLGGLMVFGVKGLVVHCKQLHEVQSERG